MVDYSMEDGIWSNKKEHIAEWFNANPEHEGRRVIVDGLFAIGDNQPDLRKRHWSSISGVFADLDNSPIGGGRRSLMTTGVKSDFDKYLATYTDNMATVIYPLVSGTAKTHGKSGGVFYRDMDDGASEYASDMTKKERLFLSGAYNAHTTNNAEKRYLWDGSYTNGYPNVTDNGDIGGQEEE
jgi:hypothetical protein